MSFETPPRRRIGAEETARGFRLTATAEGPDFVIEVSESDQKDLAKAVRSTLGAELASMIIETRKEFVERGMPLAIPDLKAFVEKQTSKDAKEDEV
jgi:hypothetical protein